MMATMLPMAAADWASEPMRLSEVRASPTAFSLTRLARLSWAQMSRIAVASWSAAVLAACVSCRVVSTRLATSSELEPSSPRSRPGG